MGRRCDAEDERCVQKIPVTHPPACHEQFFINSQIAGAEAAEDDVCGEWVGVGVFAAGGQCDFGAVGNKVAHVTLALRACCKIHGSLGS